MNSSRWLYLFTFLLIAWCIFMALQLKVRNEQGVYHAHEGDGYIQVSGPYTITLPIAKVGTEMTIIKRPPAGGNQDGDIKIIGPASDPAPIRAVLNENHMSIAFKREKEGWVLIND